MIVWLDKNIFEWQINGSVGCYNDEDIQQCYDYLEYAESLIENFDDKFHIQDCIKNLKCVADKRIKQIERTYNFKSYFPNQHILETYKKMGIVKGFVIRKLFSIRNDIEHNELEYSNKEQCQDLLDTVWYFLKSTDRLVYESDVNNDLYNDIEKENYVLTIDVEDPLIKQAKVYGKISKAMLSYDYKEGYIKLEKVNLSIIDKNLIYIDGEIVLNNELKIIIAKKFFINRILN